MKRILLAAFFMLYSVLISAQFAGYMGKRFSLFTDMSVYPALYNPVVAGQTYTPSTNPLLAMHWYGFNYRITAGFDVIVSQKSVLGADFNYYHSAVQLDTSYSSFSNEVVQDFDGFAVGAHYKVFFGRNPAPVGFYYRIETGATFYTMLGKTTAGNWYMNHSVGRQHVFFDRLILNYGLSFGFVMPTVDFYGNYVSTFEGRLSRNANLRSLSHFGMNLYFGVGVLLF